MAFVVGISTGLFACGYWLIDVLPVGSRLLAVLACLLIAVGAVACYILLQWARIPFWGSPDYNKLPFWP